MVAKEGPRGGSTHFTWALAALVLLAASCASAPPEPEPPPPATPLPEPAAIALPPELPPEVRERQSALAALAAALEELEPRIGRRPLNVSTEDERHEAFARWRAALEQAQALDEPEGRDPVALWLVASTYRQGHNLDVDGADEKARTRFERCLEVAPDFVECHKGLGELYLAGTPELAPLAEQHLRRARDLYAPSVHPVLERQIALAMVRSGHVGEALAYLDAYLVEQPGDQQTRALRGLIAAGMAHVLFAD